MKAISLGGAVGRVSYPGCGMIAGRSADGLSAVIAYFIMGRSPLTKNRVFLEEGGGVKIEPFIKSAMRDEALLVYSPVLALKTKSWSETDRIPSRCTLRFLPARALMKRFQSFPIFRMRPTSPRA